MENGPFEDVFPIENGDIPASYVIVYQPAIYCTCFFHRLLRGSGYWMVTGYM